ncbi:MAG: DUF3137 domain-containing protein [Henriciella sp.]|jgi:hypothetical protein
MALGVMDAVFASLTEQRPEFANAMKTWSETLRPALEAREGDRKATIAKATKQTIAAGLVVLAVAIAIIFFAGMGAIMFIIFGGVIATVGASSIAWLPLMSMKSETKQLVVGSAAESFGFKYNTLHADVSGITDWKSAGSWMKKNAKLSSGFKGGTPPTPAFDVLKQARLMPGYDDRKFEDLIEGDRAGTHFSLVECKLTQEQGSGKNKRTVTTFQGLLFHIQYPERFLGHTMIARRGWWKGVFGDKSLQKVDLVAKELNDNFTIYSNDQVEARALLTPDRMERLIALERHFKGGKLRGIFEGDHLTLALEAKDQFEAGSIWKTLVDPQRYISALTEIGLVCDVVDGFLTREWVKDKL